LAVGKVPDAGVPVAAGSRGPQMVGRNRHRVDGARMAAQEISLAVDLPPEVLPLESAQIPETERTHVKWVERPGQQDFLSLRRVQRSQGSIGLFDLSEVNIGLYGAENLLHALSERFVVSLLELGIDLLLQIIDVHAAADVLLGDPERYRGRKKHERDH